MTVLEKLEYLAKTRGLSERQFLMKNHLHFGLMKKIRNGYEPTPNDIKRLCKNYNFDIIDFLDSSSTIKDTLEDGEHYIKFAVIKDNPNVILEDYPHEDNARYEEKD